MANFKVGDKLVAIRGDKVFLNDIIRGKYYRVVGIIDGNVAYHNDPIVEGIDHVIPSSTIFGYLTIDGKSEHRQAISESNTWFKLDSGCKHSCCSDDKKECPFREIVT